jgi:hypothetical protein
VFFDVRSPWIDIIKQLKYQNKKNMLPVPKPRYVGAMWASARPAKATEWPSETLAAGGVAAILVAEKETDEPTK